MSTVQLGLTTLVAGQTSAEVPVNAALHALDAHVHLSVLDRDLDEPAGTEDDGDRMIVGSSPTGDWSTFTAGSVAVLINGAWTEFVPLEGWTCWVDDEDVRLTYDGSEWICAAGDSIQYGITASTTQAQGQMPLASVYSVITTCANVDDAVTLTSDGVGTKRVVINRGSSRVAVYPPSGGDIDGGATNALNNVAAASKKTYIQFTSTVWLTI